MTHIFRKKILFTFVYLISIGILFFIAYNLDPVYFSKALIIGSSLILFAQVLLVKRINGKWLNPVIVFLLSFYLFQNGQLLLYSLGIKFNDFYLQYAIKYIKEISIFTSVSNVLVGLAAILTTKPALKYQQKADSLSKYKRQEISRLGICGMLLASLVAIPLVVYKFTLVLRGGYYLVRSFESTVPAVLTFIEYMFVPFSILTLLYSSKKQYLFAQLVFFVWSIVTALCGDRTTGIAGLFIILYIGSLKTPSKHKIKKSIFAIIGFAFILVFIRFVFQFRSQNSFSSVSGGTVEIITDNISEFGFSFFPLYMVMEIIPSKEPFFWGVGYLSAFVSGCLPSFLDPTGTIRSLERIAHINGTWQDKYFSSFDFGFGYSLNAEAYSNFGWYGLFAVFLICIVIFFFLQRNNKKEKIDNFNIYEQCVLLFVWLTLPRRDSYYIWKGLVYCVILIKVYLMVFTSKKLKTTNAKQIFC